MSEKCLICGGAVDMGKLPAIMPPGISREKLAGFAHLVACENGGVARELGESAEVAALRAEVERGDRLLADLVNVCADAEKRFDGICRQLKGEVRPIDIEGVRIWASDIAKLRKVLGEAKALDAAEEAGDERKEEAGDE